MRKEVLYAIIVGISIGLIFAFGTWKLSKFIKTTPTPLAQQETPKPKTKNNTTTVQDYKDFDVINTDPIIKGYSEPNKEIVISTESKDYYIKSNNEGEFEKQIEIPAGLSEVKINELKLLLAYSTEVETAKTSVAGAITDIASNAIQIKNDKGEIKQISVAENTSYINSIKKNVSIKLSDLAIGDYVLAMGNYTSNKILETERILITSAVTNYDIEIQEITIEKISKTKINDIDLPKKWDGPDLKELGIGDQVYIVSSIDKDKNHTLRSIFKRVL